MTPEFLQTTSSWVEETLAQLSPRERIAQLLHVASWSNRGPEHQAQVIRNIEAHGIGGVIFFQGDPEDQWDFTHAYQQASKVPLMISIDAEWGLAMRLTRSVQFPYAMTMGAMEDIDLIYQAGAELGRQCRRLGIHMNHAPSVDINTEPDNPVIGFRSFGDQPEEVARRAAAFMKGMQDQGVLAVAKHFPGHGDTKTDSHLSLPLLPHDRKRLREVELKPFRHLIGEGVAGVMTGHLHVPAIDPSPNIGGTLSPVIAKQLLQSELGFEGLVITDALDMKGVTEHFTPAEINLRAALAGHDILLFCVDVPGSIEAIEQAVAAGRISQEDIDRRCRKQLLAKAWLGLDQQVLPSRENLIQDLNPVAAAQLNQQIADASVTLLKAPKVPSVPEETVSLALWASQEAQSDQLAHHQLTATASEAQPSDLTIFQEELKHAGVPTHYRFSLGQSEAEWEALNKALERADHVLLGLHGLHIKASFRFGITEELNEKLTQLIATGKVSLCVFGNGYSLRLMPDLTKCQGIVLTYQDTEYAQLAAARVMSGQAPARGKNHLKVGLS
ncbi:MAG: glycoside hydrolase family 3 N-terminal domain-containing protein [Bacteroidota bacterium]